MARFDAAEWFARNKTGERKTNLKIGEILSCRLSGGTGSEDAEELAQLAGAQSSPVKLARKAEELAGGRIRRAGTDLYSGETIADLLRCAAADILPAVETAPVPPAVAERMTAPVPPAVAERMTAPVPPAGNGRGKGKGK